MPREVLEFQPNVPVEIALAYGCGKTFETKHGERVMYTLANGQIMFLDPATAEKLTRLGVRANQRFFIRKECSGKRGDAPVWNAWLSPEPGCGEQPDGTFVVPSNGDRRAAASVSAPAAVAAASKLPTAPSNGNGSKPTRSNGTAPAIEKQNGWPRLLAQTNALVDVYAAALNYASEKHGNQIKADDVRCLLTTAYISQTKNGGPHGA